MATVESTEPMQAPVAETMERNIREQLARTLQAGGFDPARDITAITVNRWPHGYAYEYNSLWDKFWLEGGETPCEIARKPFGRLCNRQRRCRRLCVYRLRYRSGLSRGAGDNEKRLSEGGTAGSLMKDFRLVSCCLGSQNCAARNEIH